MTAVKACLPLYPMLTRKRIQEGFFLGTRHCATPLGELTRPTAEGGAPVEARTVNRDRSANTHPWTGALRSGAPPGGDRLTCW